MQITESQIASTWPALASQLTWSEHYLNAHNLYRKYVSNEINIKLCIVQFWLKRKDANLANRKTFGNTLIYTILTNYFHFIMHLSNGWNEA